MKLFFICILISGSVCGQKKWTSFSYNDIGVYSCMLVSGTADGLNQAITHHEFGRGKRFWDYRISWKNKYKNWDAGDKRARFLGSKSIFVGFTDGFHMSRAIDRLCTIAAVTISARELDEYKKRDRWKVIAKKAALSFLINRVAFAVAYNNLHDKR